MILSIYEAHAQNTRLGYEMDTEHDKIQKVEYGDPISNIFYYIIGKFTNKCFIKNKTRRT